MRPLLGLLLVLPVAAQEPLRLDTLLGSAFPSSLIAAEDAERVAWVRTERGVRNVWVAEGPDLLGRAVTAYEEDDGQALGRLVFLPGAETIACVRGGAPNRAGEIPNPHSLATPPGQEVLLVSLADGTTRSLGSGSAPAPRPDGTLVAFLRDGQVWSAPTGDGDAEQLFQVRGSVGGLAWSPDGDRLAFTSSRGTHAPVGVFDVEAATITWLDPGVDRDVAPTWSPSGRHVAFLRLPQDDRLPFTPRREGQPWSIRVVDVATGEAHSAFTAGAGSGSVFRGTESAPLHWGAGDQLLFTWEAAGWNMLWSVAASGDGMVHARSHVGELEHLTLSPDGETAVFAANTSTDPETRSLYSLSLLGGELGERLTPSGEFEWGPVVTPSGAVACLASSARTPAHARVREDGSARPLAPPPVGWPGEALVEPVSVQGAAADGEAWYGQLFAPEDAGDAPRPAVIFVHGGSRRQMLPAWHNRHYYHQAYAFNQHLASKGYVVLALNFRSGVGYGMEFREALDYGAQGGSEYQDVVAAGRWLAARDDVSKVGLWGGSYGGYLTAMGLAHDSDLFAAGVDLHGVHDWNVVVKNFAQDYDAGAREAFARTAFRASPMAAVDGWRSPVLLVHGDDDRNVPFSETVDLVAALRARDVEHEVLVYPDDVHSFLLHERWLEFYQRAAEFLDAHLVGGETEAELRERARRIHFAAVTLDTHKDMSERLAPDPLPADPAEAARWTRSYDPNVWGSQQLDFPKSRAGGLDVAFYIVYVGQGALDQAGFDRAYEQAIAKFDAIHRMCRLYPEQVGLATTPDQVEALAAEGKLVACIGIENGYCMGEDLSRIEEFHGRGARYMSIAHNRHSQLGDSYTPDQGIHGGLSDLGRRAVLELNRVGIMVDVSHTSKATMMQAVELSRAPCIASHSSARAVYDHGRNLDDEQLRALAAKGGVVQCVAFASYVKGADERSAAIQVLREELDLPRRRGGSDPDTPEVAARRLVFRERVREIEARYPRANVADFVDHIDHAVKVAGMDHVAISSDFDGGGGVTGWDDASETFNVTLELVRRGYSEADIQKLWSGNTLRMWRDVEELARSIQAQER